MGIIVEGGILGQGRVFPRADEEREMELGPATSGCSNNGLNLSWTIGLAAALPQVRWKSYPSPWYQSKNLQWILCKAKTACLFQSLCFNANWFLYLSLDELNDSRDPWPLCLCPSHPSKRLVQGSPNLTPMAKYGPWIVSIQPLHASGPLHHHNWSCAR